MTALEWVLVAKLGVTALLWAGPLLLVPRGMLAKGGVPAQAVPVARLLGWAYVALGAGYWFGLQELRAGGHPTSAIIVGIVSNGGASALLTYFGATGALANLAPFVRRVAWLSAVLTLAITLGLWWFGLRPAA